VTAQVWSSAFRLHAARKARAKNLRELRIDLDHEEPGARRQLGQHRPRESAGARTVLDNRARSSSSSHSTITRAKAVELGAIAPVTAGLRTNWWKNLTWLSNEAGISLPPRKRSLHVQPVP